MHGPSTYIHINTTPKLIYLINLPGHKHGVILLKPLLITIK